MKNKFFYNKKIASVIAFFIAIALAALICASTLTAYAEFSGQSSGITRDQLHSSTLASSVTADTPEITILTHGLGGRAKDWSNGYSGTQESASKFTKDEDSIIEKMRRTSSTGIQLFRAETHSASSFSLYSEYSIEAVDEINVITDFSKHTVVVMDIKNTKSNTMQELYDRLHFVIDKITYDYYDYSKKSRLPRINLIGHSMGGLLNMLYAIEHPKNVASLVSMGTPYNGSWYDNDFVNALGIKDFKQQPCISGTCGHDYYFCNLEKRKNTWNSIYSQNDHIKFYALSGETSITILNAIIWANNYLEDHVGVGEAVGIRALFSVLPPLNFAGGSLPGDVCVDTDSQQATGYDGVVNYNKTFTTFNSNLNKISQYDLPAPHNLEARDDDMHNCILKVIDYGNVTSYYSYTRNGMTTSIIAKGDDTWLIQLTNNTGSARSFEYNQKMCFQGDAQTWNGLGDIRVTNILANGASTIMEIQENGTASSITISYTSGNTRYIFYANELNSSSCTMNSYGNTKPYYCYTQKNMTVSIISKCNAMWTIQLTNNTGSACRFYYNEKMCYAGDAQNWTGLSDNAQTITIESGETTLIEIFENATATSIAISYTIGYTRNIFYAYDLTTSGTMNSFGISKPFYRYTQHGMEASIIGKNITKWLIKLTNNTGSARSFDYNTKMCFEGDARNWNGLTNIVSIAYLADGASIILEIEEMYASTSIAISYTDGSTRYIFYANNLDTAGTMASYNNTMPTYSYSQNGMTVGIVGKNVSKWIIKLTNNTNSAHRFYYNEKMCYAGDAQNWTGLSDIERTEILASGETMQIEISENASATSIAISYISGDTRYIFYAYDLNAAGTMTSLGSTKQYNSYTKNGMTVSIAGKSGNTWLIELTNNTGGGKTFYYNQKMCYAGDAQNWSGLSDVWHVYLEAGEITTVPLQISENATATSIAISYSVGIERYIFYAYDLNTSGTMSAFGNIKPPFYTKNGIKAAIAGKSGNTWTIQITNNTGSKRTFDYNTKMCYAGDAQNWKGLSDPGTLTLENGRYGEIKITENYSATSIAISYMDGVYRKIFYAYDLNATTGTMSAFASSIDTSAPPPDECVAAGTLITLADGTQKAVEDLTGDELLLVWNMETGSFDSAPIMFIDSDLIGHYEVISLEFSDGTTVDVIAEHGFWNVDLNEYVYLDANAAQYIGDRFNKQVVKADGTMGWTEVTLTDVEISTEVTTAYSPVTYGHLCYYVNGMLSMPGGITGLFNIFEIDEDTMTIDADDYLEDVEEYGLFTYEEFYEMYPVSEDVFNAFGGKYLKISVGKGLIDYETIGALIERYSEFF